MATTSTIELRPPTPVSKGAARAAALLLAMGESGAARVLRHLSSDEIKALTKSASVLDPISPEELDALVGEFQNAFKTGPGLSGPGRQMNELLQNALSPEDYALILAGEVESEGAVFEIEPKTVWNEIEETAEGVLEAQLAHEHPQIVAVLLCKLAPARTAKIVAGFEPRFRNEVMSRMLGAKPLAAPVDELLRTHARHAWLETSQNAKSGGRHAMLADIVNRMEKDQIDALLDEISEKRPDDAKALRELLFSFEDVVTLTAKARLVLFDTIPADTVTRALVGASSEIRECVLASMGARARRMVEAELAQMGEGNARETEAARREIAATALRLSGEGRLTLGAAEGV